MPDLDLPTAIFAVAVFLAGRAVEAIIAEVRASREAGRQAAIREEERTYQASLRQAEVEREMEAERLATTREAMAAIMSVAIHLAAGNRNGAVRVVQTKHPLEWMPTLDIALVGETDALVAAADALVDVAEHENEPADPTRLLHALTAQVRLADAFHRQDERLRRGQPLLRMREDDAPTVYRLSQAINRMMDLFASSFEEAAARASSPSDQPTA